MAKHKDRRSDVLELWLKELPKERRHDVEALAEVLMSDMQNRLVVEGGRKSRSFGRGMALEVIWAVGRWMNEPLAKRLGEEHWQSV